jgi:flagellin-specific chaperone FliS
MTNHTPSDNTSGDSFLHEAQKFGKASGTIEIEHWEGAVDNIHKILKTEALEELGDSLASEEDLPTAMLAFYCHDCRKIVPIEPRKVGKKMRKFCGECGGAKLASGREEALKKYYHLEEK